VKTQLDCFPCLISQALNTAKMVKTEKEKIHNIIKQVCLFLPTMSLDVTPSEFGRKVYRIVSTVTGIKDPFREIKKLHTKQALQLYPKLKELIISKGQGNYEGLSDEHRPIFFLLKAALC